MRRVLTALLLTASAASFAWGADLRQPPAPAELRQPPAPDDLSDPDLIDLDLDAIIAEREKLWSVSFNVGTSGRDLATTTTQGENIMTLKLAFDNLADEFEDATGINIRWQKDSFDGLSPVLELFSSVRYKFPESVVVPGIGGRLGVEALGGRTGSSTRVADSGFGAALSDEAWMLEGRALYYLPASLTFNNVRIFPGVEKREIYIGFGAGRAWAKHSIELFMPADNLSGIGNLYSFEADGQTNVYDIVLGVEEYVTPYISLNLQLGYQSLKQEELKYNDPQEVENATILINEGETATVWGPWFPEGLIPYAAIQSQLEYGWDRGDENIVVDFSGFTARAGIRYHF